MRAGTEPGAVFPTNKPATNAPVTRAKTIKSKARILPIESPPAVGTITGSGAGIGAGFVDAACRLCPVPWIETLSAMGRVNPFFERAGFVKVGVIPRTGKSGVYGRGGTLTAETRAKSQHSEPVYYVRDNRRSAPEA